MDEEEIDVVNFEPDTNPSKLPKIEDILTPFQCPECEFVGRSERGLNSHRRYKHPTSTSIPIKKPTGRPRRWLISPSPQLDDEPGPSHRPEIINHERVTTKQLLGGRKRPKTVIENVDESVIKTDREASRLHELGVIDDQLTVGEYVTRRGNGNYIDAQIDEAAGSMIVGEEIEIEECGEEQRMMEDEMHEEDGIPMQNKYRNYAPERVRNKFIPHPNNSIPPRLTSGDEFGKYKCYIEDCPWRGTYRSVRMEHMKALHPEWKMPPRFLLERISKNGVYVNPDEYVPPFGCLVQGCEWRGNFRASRSTHMRKCHPNEHAAQKKKQPGYGSNGNYMCHFPMCSWRGWSRSTRSTHLKKAHPEWKPDENRSAVFLTCFHCKNSFSSYSHLLSHIEEHGGSGLHVDEVFEGREHFANWLQRIERMYSITFERTESIPQPNDSMIYTMFCSCTAPRCLQLANESRTYVYSKHHFLKRRPHQFLTRSKSDCSVHLEIREETGNERIAVKGSLEHSGHRFGTPLVRLSHMDRQLYADVVEWKMTKKFRLMALDAVEKLNTFEGFSMDNYGPPKALELLEPLDEDPLLSLKLIVEQSDVSCFFGIDFSELHHRRLSLGYMTHEMQKMWAKYGPERVVTIDSNIVDFDNLELNMFSVLVSDENYIPKCVMIYLTTSPENAHEIVIQQLKAIDPRAPRDFMCDPSQIWVDLTEKYWPSQCTVLISEWSLMDYWAAKTEQQVPNEFDVYSIVTALRRLLRTDDVTQFVFFVIELFEALFECGYDRLAEFFDVQLADTEYFKRWSPVHRNSFTNHGHPTLAVASRILRDLYLTNENIDRVDQWFAHATKRIDEFNQVEMTQTFTLRPLDPPRKYYYNTLDIQDYHKQVVEQDTVIVYEEELDELVEGHVVEEEVIEQHELQADEEMLFEEVLVKPDASGSSGDVEDKIQEIPPHRRVFEKPEEPAEIHEEMVPSTSTSTVRRPRILMRREEIAQAMAKPPAPRVPPPPPQRETTKSVVRGGRKKKDRFAELRDYPPEVMRAIAAHAISYDGRKKEQRPFMFAPSLAQMAQSTTPTVPTPEIRPYNAAMPRQMTSQQLATLQEQRKSKKAHAWNTATRQRQNRIYQDRMREITDEHMEQDSAGPSHDDELDDEQPCSSSSLYH